VHIHCQGTGIRNHALRHLHSPYIITKLKYPTAKMLKKKIVYAVTNLIHTKRRHYRTYSTG